MKKIVKQFIVILAIGKRKTKKKIYIHLNVTSLLCTTRLENIKDRKRKKKKKTVELAWERKNGLHAIKCYSFATREKSKGTRAGEYRVCAVPSHISSLFFFFIPKCRKSWIRTTRRRGSPDLHILDRSIQERIFSYFPTFFSFHRTHILTNATRCDRFQEL